MPVDKEQAKLLEHLHAAGGRPVSFEELRSLGIENPAVLCYELDLVGVPITRVYHYPAPGHAVPVGVRIEPEETSPEAAERPEPGEGLSLTSRIGRAERIATAAGLAATRRFGRSAAGLAPTRRLIRTKPIFARQPEPPAEAIAPVTHDGSRAAGTQAALGLRGARTQAALGLGAAVASGGHSALARLGSLLDQRARVPARAREAHGLARARARSALGAGTAVVRRADPRALAGAVALTVLAVGAMALALTGQSGGSRTSFAALHGAVRAEGLASAGSGRLQGARSSSSRGGGLAARRSARMKAAASGGAGPGAERTGTQASHEHVQAGSALAATQLEARGHKLLGEGHYAAAIGDFRAALAASGQTSARCGVPGSEACLTYAYALYDLGRALRLAGKPGAAVPVLTKRLQIDNQRRTVKYELGLAKRAHGTGGVAAPRAGAAPSPKPPPRKKEAPAPAAAPAPTSAPTSTSTTTAAPAPPPPAPPNAGGTGP
jgi:hypothetical protein